MRIGTFMRLGVMTLALVSGGAAIAGCDDVVEDAAGIINDVSKVRQAAERINGAMVRVRTVKGTVGKLDDYAVSLRNSCSAWKTLDGKEWRGNMLLIMYAPGDNGQMGAYYGASLQPRVGNGQWQNVLKSHLVPAARLRNSGDASAMTTGYVNTLAGFQGLLAAAPTGRPTNVTVVQPTDYSGLWTFLKILAGLAILGGAGYAFMVYRRNEMARKKAVAEYQAMRVAITRKVTDLDGETLTAIFDSKVMIEKDPSKKKAMQADLTEFRSLLATVNEGLMACPRGEAAEKLTVEDANRGVSALRDLRADITDAETMAARLRTHDYEDESTEAVAKRHLEEEAAGAERRREQEASRLYQERMERAANKRNAWGDTSRNRDYDTPRDRPADPSPVMPPTYTAPTQQAPSNNTTIVAPVIIGSGNSYGGGYSSSSRREEEPSSRSRHSDDSGGSFSSSSSSSDSGGSFSSSDSSSSYDSGGSFSSSDSSSSSSDSGGSSSSSD